MSAEMDAAAVGMKVDALENKLTQRLAQAEGKLSAVDSKATAAQSGVQQAINWQQTLRGTQGVTVRGNVIEGPPEKLSANSDSGQTADLEVTENAALVIYRFHATFIQAVT